MQLIVERETKLLLLIQYFSFETHQFFQSVIAQQSVSLYGNRTLNACINFKLSAASHISHLHVHRAANDG